MGLIETLKKQGGIKLILKLLKNRMLFMTLIQILVLGKNRISLEIIRLMLELKLKLKLEKKYKKKLLEFDKNFLEDNRKEKERLNKIWVCWFQGLETAPFIVKKCYESLKKNLLNSEVILITNENLEKYVQFPKYILEKWKEGKISYTHMTDLLRLELLINYGGTWIDSTVFCTKKQEEIPEYYFNSELFLYQTLKPGKDGHVHIISSWFMTAKKNNKILMAVRYLCYEYWKKENKLIDYFLLHYFFVLVLEFYKEDWQKIIPKDNSTPHILLLRLFDTYDEKIWNRLRLEEPFHKLTYKFDKESILKEKTFYKEIFKGEHND